MKRDWDMHRSGSVELCIRNLNEWFEEATVVNYGMILICRSGNATIKVNFSEWELKEGSVMTLFPNDVIVITRCDKEFSAETLKYDASILREASLQLEQTVYSRLKADRCRTESKVLINIINGMFQLLKIYFEQKGCTCLDQLVVLQLKAFFLGFYDYLRRNPKEKKIEIGTPRTREIFNDFMLLLETRYKESRDVAFYAASLNITPKYLNSITQRITGHNVKTIIDHFVVLQIKLALSTTQKSTKELAWEYNFSDLSFFCKYFKQHTGDTPQQFKKNILHKRLAIND